MLRILPVLALCCGYVLKNFAFSGSSSAVRTAHHAASIRSNSPGICTWIYLQYWQYLATGI